MKNGHKYKIDVNVYHSTSFPVAMYRWEGGNWFGSWRHVESYESQAKAQAAYDAIKDEIPGLPIYL